MREILISILVFLGHVLLFLFISYLPTSSKNGNLPAGEGGKVRVRVQERPSSGPENSASQPPPEAPAPAQQPQQTEQGRPPDPKKTSPSRSDSRQAQLRSLPEKDDQKQSTAPTRPERSDSNLTGEESESARDVTPRSADSESEQVTSNDEPLSSAESGAPDVGPSGVAPGLNRFLPRANRGFASSQQDLGYAESGGRAVERDLEHGTPVSISTREFRFASYMNTMLGQIKGTWTYPQHLANAGMQGVVVYDLILNRDGSVRKIVRIKSSGYDPLDEEASRALREAGPYNPLPSRIPNDPLVIRISFSYELRYSGIF